MKILLTNDDGINAEGLKCLYNEIKNIGEVTIIAPGTEQTATSHSITLHNPLRVSKFYKHGKFWGYAVSGTPADCVKIAISTLMPQPPDLVISGINLGTNIGTYILYSGTVSAAMEACILGIPSLAISQGYNKHVDFSLAANFARKLSLLVTQNGLPKGTFLNVNVPYPGNSGIKGVTITRQGETKFKDFFHQRKDPRERKYYWLDAEELEVEESEDSEDSDIIALKNNMITITPICYKLTDVSYLDELKEWDITI